MRAKEVMTTPVITVRTGTRLKDVADLLVRHGISAVPVVDEHDELVGIVTEGDLIRLETQADPRAHALPLPHPRRDVPRTVDEVMTSEVITLPEQADVAEIARLMLKRRIKRIPIVSGRHVVGIVSRRDVLRVLARTDVEIRRELQALLEDEILMLGRFEVEVRDGVVTLSGRPDPAERRLAELLARSVPGVIAVTFVER